MNLAHFMLTWGAFFRIFVVVVGIYLLLRLIRTLLLASTNYWNLSSSWRKWIDRIPEIFEPIGIIILFVDFALVNPIVHGLILGVLLVFSLPHIRNYVNGRFIRFSEELYVGQRIQLHTGEEGTIQKLDKLGLKLQTKTGVKKVNYSGLSRDGFTVLDGTQISGFYDLLLSPLPEQPLLDLEALENKLFKCPYLDWRMRPEITPREETEGSYHLRLLMKEENHLRYFLQLANEWGFHAKPLA